MLSAIIIIPILLPIDNCSVVLSEVFLGRLESTVTKIIIWTGLRHYYHWIWTAIETKAASLYLTSFVDVCMLSAWSHYGVKSRRGQLKRRVHWKGHLFGVLFCWRFFGLLVVGEWTSRRLLADKHLYTFSPIWGETFTLLCAIYHRSDWETTFSLPNSTHIHYFLRGLTNVTSNWR